ncbi:Tll0287-like domain-containing protein [Nitrospira moscoviensis]|uniref:Tll0287-like domain-containing protein n=1 Tax=Nitrospira moscoviensis TaxID=42253 RepID=A0A0K2GHJ0_NITMO|nr:DUF3365 domain-containing protein [Nitrospira moscoviensis]ALA60334.1 conserved exported protein of unknown function [Nitrospira moscoviensis]
MPFRSILLATTAVILYLCGPAGAASVGKESAAVPVETVVDYIHAVLASDRTFYTVHVVERMQRRGVIEASENWRSASALPLPAQFFQESSSLAALTGVQVRYRLIALHPINKQSGPSTEFERKGLEAVMADPDRPYKGFVTEGGTRRFEALYADRAVSSICVSCHNAHAASPKHDYKLNDVLGAVLISIPATE